MITYKIIADTTQAYEYTKRFNWVIRFAYNRWQEDQNISLSQMEKIVRKSMNNIDLLDVSMIKMAVNQAKSLRKKEKVIFGSKKVFYELVRGKSTNKHLFQALRDYPMTLRGSRSDPKGNRKAELDIENNQVVFKPSRGVRIPFKLQNLSNKRKIDLLKLQNLCEQNEAFFTLHINNGYISIIFDEEVLKQLSSNQIEGRILSIDLNPNSIGLVVSDADRIIHKEIISFYDLNHKDISTNKKKHEKHNVSKYIVDRARHFQAQAVVIEKLNIKSKNNKKGRTFNRLVNNTWHRGLTINSIKKWCVIYGIELIEVIAAYTSYIGCILNPDEYDSIAAAMEIGNRGRCVLKNEEYEVLPKSFDIGLLPNRWKEEVSAAMDENPKQTISSWSDFITWIKNGGISYRLTFDPSSYVGQCLRFMSCKSLVSLYIFT